jgi:L-amino acid N-acyltransferase YncA
MSGIIRVATKDDAAGMLEIYAPFILNSGITQEIEVPSVEDFQQRVISNFNGAQSHQYIFQKNILVSE